jgi:hypothetical protein
VFVCVCVCVRSYDFVVDSCSAFVRGRKISVRLLPFRQAQVLLLISNQSTELFVW